jgi:hypothetical protein
MHTCTVACGGKASLAKSALFVLIIEANLAVSAVRVRKKPKNREN